MTEVTLKKVRRIRASVNHHLKQADAALAELEELLGALSGEGPVGSASEGWDDLVSSTEALEVLGVAITTLNRYRQGNVPEGRPPFPEPKRYRGRTAYWCREDLVQWCSH